MLNLLETTRKADVRISYVFGVSNANVVRTLNLMEIRNRDQYIFNLKV